MSVENTQTLTLKEALEQGYTEMVKIDQGGGKIVIAFNQDKTQARVFYQLENGHFLPSARIRKVTVSKTPTPRQDLEP